MELEKSILMQKQVRDNSQDLQNEFLDMKNWEEQMKRKERELLSTQNDQEILYPIRNKTRKKPMKENKKTEKTKESKRIKAYDYVSWDKFDVDKACNEIDNEEQPDSSSEETLSKEELQREHDKANEYKQQGNISVQQKEWNKAIAAYSEAIKIFPYDAIFYANRALCYLKQDNLYSAEADCSSAIQLDKLYVKAYHRRATARMGLKQYKEAKQDLEKILKLEPSNKEAQMLLNQVNKRLESLKPIVISEKDLTEDIPVEKKIGEKMLGNITPSKKQIDTKEKIEKNQINVESSAIKPITPSVREPKLNSCIPDWLPEKDNVAIVQPIKIPPHLRSKEPLRKIPVQLADLTKPLKRKIEELYNGNVSTKLSDVPCTNAIKHTESVKKNKEEENLNSHIKLPIPKTAVQFLLDWRKYVSYDFRYRYLMQLSPESLPDIFQNSMESYLFTDILVTLQTEFMKREKPIFLYLKSLSNIRRFKTFTMFMTKSEKENLKLMFSYCETFEKISKEKVVELQNKYEI